MAETPKPGRVLRSIGAVFAGIVLIIVLSLATDVVLHATGIYPPWFQPMAGPLWALALAYRLVYNVVGSYFAAWLAQSRPMAHALIVGLAGFVLTIIGVAVNWNAGPEYGPRWFSIALVLTAIPCAWLGGFIRVRRQAE